MQNWFILLPEFCLIMFFPITLALDFFVKEKNAKTFYIPAYCCLGLSLAFSILFYNKSAFPDIWQKTPFNTLFITFNSLLALAWLYLSSKWFLNKNQPAKRFYNLCFALLLGANIVACSNSLISLASGISWIFFFTFLLILKQQPLDKAKEITKYYAAGAILFFVVLWCAVLIVYHQTHSFIYADIKQFYSDQSFHNALSIIAVAMVVAVMMFVLAQIPFHQWFINIVSESILPVSGFVSLVMPLMFICALINLVKDCFSPFISFIMPIVTLFSILSLIISALSVNREQNIRRLAAFLTIYCIGYFLIGISDFSKDDIIASFAYILVAFLSLSGFFTVFLGMKSRGEYLRNLQSINGFYALRPYMSAALLVFGFSLIGLAPTLGFFGYLSVINNLVNNEAWIKIILLITSSLFVAAGIFAILRSVYFETPSTKYDRPDKAVYICLFINMVLILLSLLNPSWLMHDILIILGGVS